MKFITAINCMDGRVQLPAIRYLQNKFDAKYVDMLTEPGPNKILSDQSNGELIQSLLNRIDISVNKHGSTVIAVVGHHDCAGNPSSKSDQIEQNRKAIQFLEKSYPDVQYFNLWVNDKWEVTNKI